MVLSGTASVTGRYGIIAHVSMPNAVAMLTVLLESLASPVTFLVAAESPNVELL